MTQKKEGGQLAEKLRKDVEAALAAEFGDNPQLVQEIEGVLEKIADVALADVVAQIRNPIIRVILKTAMHDAIDKAFEAFEAPRASPAASALLADDLSRLQRLHKIGRP